MFFSVKFQVLKLRFLAFSQGPGGFREVREAGRKHFHLSWYLSVAVVTSYDLLNNTETFYVFLCFSRVRFSLDSILAAWDLEFRIPRRKLRI